MCLVLLSCRIVNPLGTITAIVTVSVVFVVLVLVGNNQAAINNFKKQKPAAFVFLVMVATCLLISVLGNVMVFIWAITVPVICKLMILNIL